MSSAKLLRVALDPFIYVTDGIKQNWSQYGPLRSPSCHCSPSGHWIIGPFWLWPPISTPYSGQAEWEPGIEGCVHLGFEYLQGWSNHNPHSKTFSICLNGVSCITVCSLSLLSKCCNHEHKYTLFTGRLSRRGTSGTQDEQLDHQESWGTLALGECLSWFWPGQGNF